MYCRKRGTPIDGTELYSPYCGALQKVEQEQVKNVYSPKGTAETFFEQISGRSAFEYIAGVFYVIVFLQWTWKFLSRFGEYTKGISWIDTDVKVLGTILYIVVFTIMAALCLIGIREFLKARYYISLGTGIALVALIMKIGYFLVGNRTFDTFNAFRDVILSRIFRIYGDMGITTLIMGVFIVIVAYIKKAKM